MECSIVIPHRDRFESLDRTIGALLGQDTNMVFEIIVVDDGSEGDIGGLLNRRHDMIEVRLLEGYGKGISHARNVGWRAAKGDVVLFLDCDLIVDSRFVENTCSAFLRYPGEIVQFGERRYLAPTTEASPSLSCFETARGDERYQVFDVLSCNMASFSMSWHLCYGHSISVRRDALLRHGGFDEDFTGWGLEDSEFAFRHVSAGARLVFNPGMVAYHQHHETIGKTDRFAPWIDNLERFEQKHRCFEVKAQYILGEYFNPNHPNKNWARSFIDMERAVRSRGCENYKGNEIHWIRASSLDEIRDACRNFADRQIVVSFPRTDHNKLVDVQLDSTFDRVKAYIF